jgi:DNA polymerase III alpha subunit (gram-positive type)
VYLIIDTETGGTNPRTTSLLQLYAAAVDRSLKILDTFSANIIPDDGIYKVTPGALNVNKIDLLSHSKTAGRIKDVQLKFESWLCTKWNDNETAPIMVVGWNVNFDVRFIVEQLLPDETWNKYCGYRVFDLAGVVEALKLRGKLPDTCKSLGKTAEHLGIDTSGAHDAGFDVHMTLQVMRKLLFLL